jgi:hypothetical protein
MALELPQESDAAVGVFLLEPTHIRRLPEEDFIHAGECSVWVDRPNLHGAEYQLRLRSQQYALISMVYRPAVSNISINMAADSIPWDHLEGWYHQTPAVNG